MTAFEQHRATSEIEKGASGERRVIESFDLKSREYCGLLRIHRDERCVWQKFVAHHGDRLPFEQAPRSARRHQDGVDNCGYMRMERKNLYDSAGVFR